MAPSPGGGSSGGGCGSGGEGLVEGKEAGTGVVGGNGNGGMGDVNKNIDIAARAMSQIAEGLAAFAGNQGGLRSGPAQNRTWQRALDALSGGSTGGDGDEDDDAAMCRRRVAAVAELSRLRRRWCGAPKDLIRAVGQNYRTTQNDRTTERPPPAPFIALHRCLVLVLVRVLVVRMSTYNSSNRYTSYFIHTTSSLLPPPHSSRLLTPPASSLHTTSSLLPPPHSSRLLTFPEGASLRRGRTAPHRLLRRHRLPLRRQTRIGGLWGLGNRRGGDGGGAHGGARGYRGGVDGHAAPRL